MSVFTRFGSPVVMKGKVVAEGYEWIICQYEDGQEREFLLCELKGTALLDLYDELEFIEE